MKNELFAKAVTGIDDALIAEAHKKPTAKILHFGAKQLGLVAACLVIGFISLMTLASLNKTDVTLDGKRLGEAHAVEVNFGNGDDKIRTLSQQSALTLKITSHESVNLSVSEGTLCIKDDDSRALHGTSLKTKAPLTFEWLIDELDTEKTYTLTVNEEEFSLFYNSESDSWKIIKLRKD